MIELKSYQPEFKQAFKDLNKAWIDAYFVMEDSDYKMLEYPEENIIDKGGHILFVLDDGIPIGTCALLKTTQSSYDYELAKMAISPSYQGKGLGYKLGNAILEKARSVRAKSIFLESNTKLKPALHLYKKLGFRVVEGLSTPYQRCNIQMEYHF